MSMIDHLKRLNNTEHCVQLLAHKKCPMSSQIYIFRGSGGIPLLHYIENEMVPRVVISLMNSLLSAVKYIHSKYICHRDIKLENIFVLDGDVPSIQLANFHCSITFFPEENTLTGFVGNRAYMAPEIFNKGLYTPAVDFWACGVVLYTICLGHFPWIMDLGDEALEQQIVGNEPMWSKLVEFEEKDKGWVGVVDLAHQLMAWDPKAREQASNHPWIKN
uniref:Protein kinase domain-containing protein n=1 Tax=Arcella intermedia TaxID=1963864 RepID=A0A6B2LH31_9EUKA